VVVVVAPVVKQLNSGGGVERKRELWRRRKGK